MGEEGLEPFEVSDVPQPPQEAPARQERRVETVAEKKYLRITVVDHNAVIEGTGEESYVNLRIPVAMAEAGLKMLGDGKLGKVNPDLIVEMIEDGATGELVSIAEERKIISIRVE